MTNSPFPLSPSHSLLLSPLYLLFSSFALSPQVHTVYLEEKLGFFISKTSPDPVEGRPGVACFSLPKANPGWPIFRQNTARTIMLGYEENKS